MIKRTSFFTTSIIFAQSLVFSSSCLAQADREPVYIDVDSIGSSVILVGRLGKPLGTKIIIKGKWHLPGDLAKDSSAFLVIHEVDEVALPSPVKFHVNQLEITTKQRLKAIPPLKSQSKLAGKEWSMIAYETGYEKPFTTRLVAVLDSTK